MLRDATISQIDALLNQGRYHDAARLLLMSAATGNAKSCAMLAQWRIAGNVVRRDLTAARALLGKAASGGDRDAALLHANFLAAGVGGDEDWSSARANIEALAGKDQRAKAQLRLLAQMHLDALGNPETRPTARVLSEMPQVTVFENFVTDAERTYLKTKLAAALTPSVVVDPSTGRMVPHPIRSSDGAAFGVFDEDMVVNAINRRIAAASGTRAAAGEPLQMLRYRPGGEYRAHSDALPGEGNQRVLTMIVYLSDGYSGGETHFPRTGLTFRGRAGDALLFRNVTDDGRPDPLALHAGLPVTRGEKLIATRWIRKGVFTYPPPQPLLNL